MAPGILYRMEVDVTKPMMIHAIRWTPAAKTASAQPVLGADRVFVTGESIASRESVPDMVLRTKAIGGINADFFPWTGDPLGAMIREGQLISTPDPRRSVFVWGEDYLDLGRLEFAGKAIADEETTIILTGVNQMCHEDEAVLFTEAGGEARSEGDEVIHLVLEMPEKLPATGSVTATTKHVVGDSKTVRVEPGHAILTVSGKQSKELIALSGGKEIELRVNLKGVEVEKVQNAIGGGPAILSAGQVALNLAAEGFAQKFADTKHPRTAVGKTASGDVWLVVVDGRQPDISVGATLGELADIMIRLGCVEAMNLDGGGSSTLALNGVVLNRPSDPKPRPVSNAILLYGPQPLELVVEDPELPTLVITGKAQLSQGASHAYSVADEEGVLIPNTEILWSAIGAGWVDQGGRFTAVNQGEAKLRAAVRGGVLEVTVRIE